MTLDEFMERAHPQLDAFAAATRTMQERGDPAFTGPHMDRTEQDWWREVVAYHGYVELEELIRMVDQGEQK